MKAAHLSDLHLGRRTSGEKLKSLTTDLLYGRPDVLIVSGDVTDRGSVAQFKWAREFLDALAIPYIAVPGNREIGLTAPWEWMFPRTAMNRFSRYFGPKDRVVYVSEEHKAAFFGLNSVHWFPSWPGSITRETRYWLREETARYPGYFKAVFLHHPVLPVIRGSSFWAHTFTEAGEVLNICTENGVSLVMQGHKHRSAIMEFTATERNATVIVSAGGAPLMPFWDSSYHLIRITADRFTVSTRDFVDNKFQDTAIFSFPLENGVIPGRSLSVPATDPDAGEHAAIRFSPAP